MATAFTIFQRLNPAVSDFRQQGVARNFSLQIGSVTATMTIDGIVAGRGASYWHLDRIGLGLCNSRFRQASPTWGDYYGVFYAAEVRRAEEPK